ncbi:hypothetical protein M1N10_02740 [Thermodesulfovibrionales bacterium]|nr:hypothetical protein [Thermodesulfovibrionales bacterium]
MPKAIALYSGGLDSSLAILTIMRQGIEVTAVTFLTDFGCYAPDMASHRKDQKLGFEVKLCRLTDKFMEIVKRPRFGHGKNMNPCIDCKILMLNEAKELMPMQNAAFIITGDVLGQRPMSQRREILQLIDREVGLEGYILRPLSAKLLKPTIAEQTKIVEREMLYDFSGRSRRPQIALAEEFGLTDYPTPAGGCLLTDPIYSYRLKELLIHNPSPSVKDINLLRTGRHFRISEDCKIIVGRDKGENDIISSLSTDEDYLLKVEKYGSPTTIICGDTTDEIIKSAAAICARYSDAKHLKSVRVRVYTKQRAFTVVVSPAVDDLLDYYRIQSATKSRESRVNRSRLNA